MSLAKKWIAATLKAIEGMSKEEFERRLKIAANGDVARLLRESRKFAQIERQILGDEQLRDSCKDAQDEAGD